MSKWDRWMICRVADLAHPPHRAELARAYRAAGAEGYMIEESP